MPSVADLIFVALLGVLVFTPLSVRLLGDAGIGWHIRTGQQILATHAIPRVDSFSSTMAGRPWFAWEWLYDVVVGLLEARLGLNGVVWFTAVVIAAVFACDVSSADLRAERTCWWRSLLMLLATSASTIHFLARPHVVSWLFTLAWFWILDSSERDCLRGQGRIAMAVGASVSDAGVGECARRLSGWIRAAGNLSCSERCWTWFRAKENRIEELLQKSVGEQASAQSGVGRCCFRLRPSLINPYGWKLYAHIYSYLSNRFLMDHIDEFQSPNFHGLAQKCFLILILITVAVLAVRGRELRVSTGLTVLFAVYAGLYASRNIPVSSILLVMVGRPIAAAPGIARGFFAENDCRGSRTPRSCMADCCDCRNASDRCERRAARDPASGWTRTLAQADARRGRELSGEKST